MVGLALGHEGEAAVVQRRGQRRVDFDGLIEVTDSAVVVAHIAIGEAAVVIGKGVVRRGLEHGIEIRHRAIRRAGSTIRHCTVVDRQRALRIEFDRLGQVGDGALVVALFIEHVTAGGIVRWVARIGLDRLIHVRQRVIEVALLAIGIAAMEIHGRQRGRRLVLAGLDRHRASRDQLRLRRVLVQARRPFRDVLNGLRLRPWRLRLLLRRLRLTHLLLRRALRRRPDRVLRRRNQAPAILLRPRRHLRKRWSRLEQKACNQRRPADDLPHSPDHILPPLRSLTTCVVSDLSCAYARFVA